MIFVCDFFVISRKVYEKKSVICPSGAVAFQMPEVVFDSPGSFANKMVWSTVSNAFLRSRKIASFTSLLSMVEYQESILFIQDVIVEYILRKTAWFFVNIG